MADSTFRRVPAVDKAARLLATLGDTGPLGISELARRIGASKGTVRDVLLTMAAHGLVRRDENGRFSVHASPADLRAAARGALETLAAEAGETAFLGLLDGDAIVIADIAEPATDLHMTTRIGRRVPVAAGAHGKVLVRGQAVGLDDEEYLEGVRAAAAPIRDGSGRPIAVLILVGFKSRVTLTRLREFGKLVATRATEVTARLAQQKVA